MNRPYVICHMTTSLDGKVTGEHLFRSNHSPVSEVYYKINRNYKADAYACGRVTMEGSFTGGWYPDLSEFEPDYNPMDHLADDLTGFYAVAFDPHGRLGWKSDRIIDADKDPGYDKAQIIEVLTHDVDLRYLTYLQSMGIPYIFAGDTEIDVEEALFKLKNYFGIEKILLEGGSILNGAFQRAGVIDELSLVVDPVIGGEGKPLCMDSRVEEYRLVNFKNYDGILWLNHKKIHTEGRYMMLEVGMKAPEFTLSDKDGNTVSLSDFLGKKVVLYFYPKDNTPGCTRQACAFAASYEGFKSRDVVVIGVSRDSAASHQKFAQKHNLPFILLSDPELQAIQAYGVWQEKKLYGKVSMGVVRSTFIIDELGVIEKVMPKVKPDTNAAEILAYLSGES